MEERKQKWCCLGCFQLIEERDGYCPRCSNRRGGPWNWSNYEFASENEDAQQTERDDRWHKKPDDDKDDSRER